MLRKLAPIALVIVLASCDTGADPATAARVLPGEYAFRPNNGCTYGPVKSDQLILYPNGTYDQHLRLQDGRSFDSTGQKWVFISRHNIGMESRWDYPAGAKAPIRESDSLVVEFSKPPVIVIDPDNNCFYEQVASH
jgi:hypothetical protein